MLEREQKIATRLLITGSGVRVPHNPLRFLQPFGNALIKFNLSTNVI
jgi:hypothetical protein